VPTPSSQFTLPLLSLSAPLKMMHWQYTPFALPLLIAATISAALAFYTWRHRSTPGATGLGLMTLAVVEWGLAYALELSSANLPAKLFWAKVQYLGIVIAPLAVLIFALQYTGREKWLTRRNLALLAIEPLIVVLLVSTNETHNLFWNYTRLVPSGSFPALDIGYGAGFWVHMAYSYLLLLAGTILLIRMLFRSPRLYRKQSTAVMTGVLVPWVGNVVYVMGLSPVPNLDLTPFAFTVTGMVLTWGLFQYRLLDVMPLAQDIVFKNANDGVIILDAQNRIVGLNPAAERILDCTASEAVGRMAVQVIPSQEVPLLERHREVREAHEELKLGDGPAQRDYHLTLSSLRDQSGGHSGRLIVLCDITEHKLKERLDYLAHHDPLTELPNRTLFYDRLNQAITWARSNKESLALLFIDLDRFKLINDVLGHDVGDIVLQKIARRLTTCLRREGDTVARWGGDEFVMMLLGIAQAQDAVTVAQRLLNTLSDTFVLKGHEFFITPSIGICLCPSDAQDPITLVRNADIAMHRAKARGRGRYDVYATKMSASPSRQLNLETDLRRVIKQQQLKVYYQPIVLLETGKMVGAEALARWEHPKHGLILPSEFIPLAEEIGLIIPIGQWIIGEACRQAQMWQERYPSDPSLMVCVNLSIGQLQHSDFIAETLREIGLNPHSLVLEITESAAVDDTQPTAGFLQELKGLGVQLAIDDFGTGYSSLSYLKHLPVDFLKIDRSFVGGLGQDAKGTKIVSTIIELSHALGSRVIAEGVETADQLAQLQELGCTLAQGHYFAKPLTTNSLWKHLERSHSGSLREPKSHLEGYPSLHFQEPI
jgi:diguanylate cyclase (GGDEF)-like protein/PAS domain S-box-containing protein